MCGRVVRPSWIVRPSRPSRPPVRAVQTRPVRPPVRPSRRCVSCRSHHAVMCLVHMWVPHLDIVWSNRTLRGFRRGTHRLCVCVYGVHRRNWLKPPHRGVGHGCALAIRTVSLAPCIPLRRIYGDGYSKAWAKVTVKVRTVVRRVIASQQGHRF